MAPSNAYVFSLSQLDAARRSEVLRGHVARLIGNVALLDKSASALSKAERDELDDAVADAFLNLELSVEVRTGYGGYGEFPIAIIGVPGAYRVSAPEFDLSPCFDTIEQARDWLESDFGSYLEKPES